MAVWECGECTTKYSVGAPECPQCGSVVRVNEKTQPPKEGQDMAKVTVHGGPSNAAADEAESVEEPAAESSEAEAEEPKKAPQRRTRN
jgi:predicted ATP-dependent serine protease